MKDMAEKKNGIPYYLGLSHHDFNLFFFANPIFGNQRDLFYTGDHLVSFFLFI